MITLNEIARRLIHIGLSETKDPIRSLKGRYYSSGFNGALTYNNTSIDELVSNLIKLRFTAPSEVGLSPSAPYTKRFRTKVTAEFDEESLDKIIDNILNSSNAGPFTDIQKFQVKSALVRALYEELNNILTTNPNYSNITFESNPLLSLKEQQTDNFIPSTYYNFTHNYNFFNNYETFIGSLPEIGENLLPNLYFYSNKDAVLTSSANSIKTLVSLYETIPSNQIYTEAYWNNWVTSYPQFVNTPYSSIVNGITDLLFITKNEFNILSDDSLVRNQFPFYETIKFTTEADSFLITKNIQEIGISCDYLKSYISLNSPTTRQNFSIFTQNNSFTASYDLSSSVVNYYNFNDIISSSLNLERNFVTTLQKECGEIALSELQKFIINVRLNNHFASVCNSRIVNYKDLFNSNLDVGDSQIVLYTLEKYKIQNNFENFIQIFHFLNYDEVQDFIYHDTQIKYGETYKYICKAQYAVIGTEYNYSNINTGSATDVGRTRKFYYEINSYPVLKSINNIILFEKSFTLRDSAPLPPQVNIVPYRGINNKILFLFNTEVGSRYIEPIIIKSSDNLSITRLRETQEIESGPILFSSDNAPVFFEIYRSTVKPTKFEDFENYFHAVSLTNGNFSSEYEDSILPNTKYYYTFRCLDVHGNLSNPTYVYEIELVDDGGAVYDKINVIYEFENVNNNYYTKNIKRFLHILPPITQTAIFIEGEDKNDFTYNFGIAEDPVWNKEFKIRLKSKTTGKVIDLNVNFANSSSVG